jgi:hypothetical protein
LALGYRCPIYEPAADALGQYLLIFVLSLLVLALVLDFAWLCCCSALAHHPP